MDLQDGDVDVDVDGQDGLVDHHHQPYQHARHAQHLQHHLHRQDDVDIARLAQFPPPPPPLTTHFSDSPGPSYPYSPDAYAVATPDSVSSTDHHAFTALNPDDFYKSYRALHLNSNPDTLPMAASIPRPSLRSNGDGTTPRHPVMPSERHARRPNVRSSSNPADSRPALGKKAASSPAQPSVKDLKKRFDQSNASSSIPRAQSRPGAPTRAKRDGVASPQARGTANSYTALRGAVTQDSPVESPGVAPASQSQRPKFVAEDEVSANVQSFASRIGKPRGAVSGNPNASRSMTNLQHNKSPPQQPQPSTSSAASRPQGLLFGEILPEQHDSSMAGYGIEGNRPRRTSDSSLQPQIWGHRRNPSDPDADSLDPSSWYRNLERDNTDSQSQHDPRRKGHARSRSDVAITKSTTPITRKPATRIPATASHSQPPSISKLPLSVRKLTSPTNSSSPPSTRSNSPSGLQRSQANGKASRTRTPTARTNTPTSRAKTPTQTTSSRKPAPQGLVTPNNNNRLQAYISAPPPKLSPPLRSSRPRQPVSMATTASSRMKAVDRGKSPNPAPKGASRIAEPSFRRRKLSVVGPIDFEQRREHIRLAYTKSIRESQAFEARQKAADQRRKEMEAAAKARAAARAATASTSPLSQCESPDDGAQEELEAPVDSPAEPRLPSPDDLSTIAADVAAALPPASLTITPPDIANSTAGEGTMGSFDSPTLGLPGSFPALSPPIGTGAPNTESRVERPKSCISAISETTEFDNEPQTNPPVQAYSPLEVPITIVKPPSPRAPSPRQPGLEYQYPFESEPQSSALLETNRDVAEEPRETASVPVEIQHPIIPGAFAEEPVNYQTSPETEKPTEPIGAVLPARERGKLVESKVPFPRIETNDDSDCHSESDNVAETSQTMTHTDEDPATDACTEATDDHERGEEFRSDSHCDDQTSSHRASTCESSEISPAEDAHRSTFDQHPTPDTSRSLLAPAPLLTDRSSQQSGWTDFSIESGDFSSAARGSMLIDPEALGHATIFETTSIHRESRTASRHYDSYFSQSDVRPSVESTRSSASYSQHQLPELDTGEGFSIPYLSHRASRNLSYVPSPNHDPPAVPNSVSGSGYNSQRTSAAYYEQSQYESTLISSERGSEDFIPPLATPQSIDTASVGTSDQYFPSAPIVDGESKVGTPDKNEPTGKERHRLVQRRNVIKELVDTEAVFVRDMNIVEEIYKGTAEACPKLDAKTIKLIFRNTDEIIEFHTSFLTQVKEAVASIYAPQIKRSPMTKEDAFMTEPGQFNPADIDDAKDRKTTIGPVFGLNMDKMKLAHEGFLRNSDQAAKQLIQIQQDPTVKVWLNECNEVAKDLTAAWDLDSLLIKPMQRITKYPNLIVTLLQHTPQDHPDREALINAKEILETAIIEINKTKKNFELVGQIVGRKRKESDVKAGFARAFGKRVDKLQASSKGAAEDPDYAKLNEKFGDDYLRLQVVLRDVEFYTRQVSAYVHEFLQYLSSIELVMRLQPGSYPELESKWVQFNISIRDLEKVALEDHLAQVRKHVIEPFELVIKAYGNPSLAMKKRQKRRVDYERYEQLKRGGKTADAKLTELVEQYEALNDTLKKELPKLSALTEKVGNICLGNFVNIQAKWYGIWKDKMRVVLGDCPDMPDLKEVVSSFQRDYPYALEQLSNIAILNPTYKGRMSQSTTTSGDDTLLKVRSRPSDIDSARSRGLSMNGDQAPILPTPDFGKRNSGSFTMSPTAVSSNTLPSPHQYYYRDYYSGIHAHQPGGASPLSPEVSGGARSFAGTSHMSTRPSTGRSFDSGGLPMPMVIPRQSSDSAALHQSRDSNSTYNSGYPPQDNRRFSGLFHSALPLPDGPEDSQRSSRASSRDRGPTSDGYNVLWLAASLFEFNIATTKHEAGYPYLVYQAGEIFDVIGEKGELWLAKNQDDSTDQVGWIWSKHFARLADS